jgi:hypothetical protein
MSLIYNVTISILDYTASNGTTIHKWKIGKDVGGNWRTDLDYPGICIQGLRRSTNILAQDMSPGRDLNLGLPKHEAAVLPTRP